MNAPHYGRALNRHADAITTLCDLVDRVACRPMGVPDDPGLYERAIERHHADAAAIMEEMGAC